MEIESAADYVSESETTCTYSSQSCTADEIVAESSNIPASSQNRRKWSNFARMCERYQVSDRAAAVVANIVLVDVGMVTDDDKTCVIDRSKLRRETERCRPKSEKEEQQNFRFVNALYCDGRKDATQILVQGPNDKHYRSVELQEHYTVVGESGSYYLTHFYSKDRQGRTIAQEVFDSVRGTELEDRLAIVGTDGTACMTGKYNECIRHWEELLHRPLQRIVCLLHANELPLRHVFSILDDSTSGPNTFTGPIGKCLHGSTSTSSVGQFEQIAMPTSSFPKLPTHVVVDLSTDQHYAIGYAGQSLMEQLKMIWCIWRLDQLYIRDG